MNVSIPPESVQETVLVDVGEASFAGPGGLLHRRWVRPAGLTVARLAIVHGYGEHCGRYLHFMRWLAERGVACETFDFRGHGKSAGRRGAVVRWDEFFDDLRAFFDLPELATVSPGGPLFVLGHSHGGLVTAAAGVRGLLDPTRWRGVLLSAPYLRHILPVPTYRLLAGRVLNVIWPNIGLGNGMGRDLFTHDPEMMADTAADPLVNRVATPRWFFSMRRVQEQTVADAANFTLPLLCMVAGSDPIADPATAERFFSAARSADKTLIRYPDSLHEILREVDRLKAFEDVFAWIRERI